MIRRPFFPVFVVAAVLSATTVVISARSLLDAVGIEKRPTKLDAIQHLDLGLQNSRLIRFFSAASIRQVALFGDSLTMSMGGVGTDDYWLDGHLEQQLNAASPPNAPVHVSRISYSGLSQFSHWFLLDEMLVPYTEVALVALNLYAFSPTWLARDRIHVAAFVPPRRWLQALRLPLYSVGLSADRLFFYGAMYRAGLLAPWLATQVEQARVANAYWDAERYLQTLFGDAGPLQRQRRQLRRLGVNDASGRTRIGLEAGAAMFSTAMHGVSDEHPVLVVLESLIQRLRARGARVIVYVAPHNIDRLRQLGLYDADGLARSLAVVRSLVEANDARLIDLHDLLDDDYFVDRMDHLEGEGENAGLELVARKLVPEVLDELNGSRGAH